jgi:hypothetical protein
MIWRWQVFLLILIGAMIAAGYYVYNLSPKSPRIVGDKLYLPKNCFESRFRAVTNLPPQAFTKFDQKYPEHWPNGFQLPTETYVSSLPLTYKPVENEDFAKQGYYAISTKFILAMKNDDAVAYLRDQYKSAGLLINNDKFQPSDPEDYPPGLVEFERKYGTYMDGRHIFIFDRNQVICFGAISVDYDHRLKDYSVGFITFTYLEK